MRQNTPNALSWALGTLLTRALGVAHVCKIARSSGENTLMIDKRSEYLEFAAQ